VELSLSSEDAAFRDEVRAYIADNYPQEMRVPNPNLSEKRSRATVARKLDGKQALLPK
jgi:hypothetical protein